MTATSQEMAGETPAGCRMDRSWPACGFVDLQDPVTSEMLGSEFARQKASPKETEYRLKLLNAVNLAFDDNIKALLIRNQSESGIL